MPEEIRPVFFGAILVALEKKSGGVRPITVGCTLRRLVAKVACFSVVDEMAELLSPRQLGYGVRGVLRLLPIQPESSSRICQMRMPW